jgi:GTP cyclohydrolase I
MTLSYQTTAKAIPDIQSTPDHRGIALDQVGVQDIRFPISVLDKAETRQQTVAVLSMSVALPHHFKGTHMSRFIEVLNAHSGEFTIRTIPEILLELRKKLDAESAQMEVRFPYFLKRTAPASNATGLMDYQCVFAAESNGHATDFTLTVQVPVTSLCPCSKEISDYGAHNQRGQISISVRSENESSGQPALIWIEELVEIAENAGSAPVYPLLKRVDERHVTMQAFDNPVFVEDMVRNVAVSLKADRRVSWFEVRAVNQESIHNHDAFAMITWKRPQAASDTIL